MPSISGKHAQMPKAATPPSVQFEVISHSEKSKIQRRKTKCLAPLAFCYRPSCHHPVPTPHPQALAGVTTVTNVAKAKARAIIGMIDRFIFRTPRWFYETAGGDRSCVLTDVGWSGSARAV